ncbi:secretory lipase [Dyadobacter jejuensis]|uniref:Secretory lipase n=1 Tax=Dyadobacter jejuensis TaxID=1082580 RepID=A0A316AIX8_9BACT|nr:lipase family protein [Dyadobacter jejuensis]PWJ57542.1 secretory lipase [Dyadobacter jejuensis]
MIKAQVLRTPFFLKPFQWLALSLIVFFASCSKKDDTVDPVDDPSVLVSSTQLATLTKAELTAEAVKISPLLAAYVKNGVIVYKLTYQTKNTDGQTITATGAVIVPDTNEEVPLLSVQHGTIESDASAPSNFQPDSEAATFGALFGAQGYIISYPDYIGYGASKDFQHPYEHRASLASASLDMLRAVKEFIAKENTTKWNNKLFLAGYSEGGYATMSLQKKIEEEASSEFNLVASSCGAGAYDKTAFMKYIVNAPTHGIASYNKLYLWVLLTYDRVYGLNRPASYYFKEPYASGIQSSGLDYPIDVSFNSILTDSFRKAVADGTDTALAEAIADNDVYNWKPTTPTRLYHGTDDQLVFFFNSQNAYDAMTKLGAPDLQLIPVSKGTHSTSIDDFLLGTLLFFTGK